MSERRRKNPLLKWKYFMPLHLFASVLRNTPGKNLAKRNKRQNKF